MTRTTRAALRSQELAEEAAAAASVPLPSTPQRERMPLGEISDNRGPEPALITLTVNNPIKPPAKKGRQGKGGKKGNKKAKENVPADEIVILEDGDQSSASSAVEETRQKLSAEILSAPSDEVFPDTMEDVKLSPAVDAANNTLSPRVDPAQSDADLEKPKDDLANVDLDKENVVQDLKVDTEKPNESTPADKVGVEVIDEDSFIKDIRARSPAKRVSRIEDSVEALDKLDEEIEKATQAIPASKTKTQTESTPKASLGTPGTKIRNKPVTKAASASNKKPAINQAGVSSTKAVKPSTNSKPRTSRKSPIVSPTDKMLSMKRHVAKIVTGVEKAESQQQPAKTTKRLSSIHKAPFQPTKSSKPPTRASFELPGEAVARKLREQREERLKREAETTIEDQPKSKAFKARPRRISQAPEVKMTATAKARLSMAKTTSSKATGPSASPKRIQPVHTVRSKPSTSSQKRTSSALVSNSNGIARKLGTQIVPDKRISSVGSGNSASPAHASDTVQNQKGKAAFARPKIEMAERERSRKEKEEATKKARLEAAERGRVASRQWAEKQKERNARKVSAEKAAT